MKPLLRNWGILLVAVSVFAAMEWAFTPSTVDDAYISFRYARNLLEGHGLVYNVGERVEGYTNFLWTLVITLPLALGIEPGLASHILGSLCTAIALGLMGRRLARTLFPDSGWSVLTIVLLLFSPSLAFWSGAGLETTFFLLCVVLSRVLIAQCGFEKPVITGFALAALPLCRPDGLIFVVTALGLSTFYATHKKRNLLITAAIVAGVLFAYTTWKLTYYGALFPVSYHAKVQWSFNTLKNGIRYIFQFVRLHPWAIFALPEFWLARRSNPLSSAGFIVPLLRTDVLLFTLYLGWIGGDSMVYSRFFVPLLPAFAVLTTRALQNSVALWPKTRHWFCLAISIATITSTIQAYLTDQAIFAFKSHRITELGLGVGRFLEYALPKNSTLATNAAGALAYASKLHTIDMLGINDVHIAHAPAPKESFLNLGHARGDGRYVAAKNPDVILFGNTVGSIAPYYFSDFDFAKEPSFARNYVRLSISYQRLLEVSAQPAQSSTSTLRILLIGHANNLERTDAALGLVEQSTGSGLFSLRNYRRTDVSVHLYVRADRMQSLLKIVTRKP